MERISLSGLTCSLTILFAVLLVKLRHNLLVLVRVVNECVKFLEQAYRDLTKVWHPDRFDDGDTRLRQKAEEQLKTINDAYARIQEAHLCINSR